MTSDRIKEIQEGTAYPNSRSVYQALFQVWNECGQEQSKNIQTEKIKAQIQILDWIQEEEIEPHLIRIKIEQQLKKLEDGEQ
jgi:hypothetical protein